MFTTASCLAVGLALGLDLVCGWRVIMHMYYFLCVIVTL